MYFRTSTNNISHVNGGFIHLFKVSGEMYVNDIFALRQKHCSHARILQLYSSIYLKARLCKKAFYGCFVAKIRHTSVQSIIETNSTASMNFADQEVVAHLNFE